MAVDVIKMEDGRYSIDGKPILEAANGNESFVIGDVIETSFGPKSIVAFSWNYMGQILYAEFEVNGRSMATEIEQVKRSKKEVTDGTDFYNWNPNTDKNHISSFAFNTGKMIEQMVEAKSASNAARVAELEGKIMSYRKEVVDLVHGLENNLYPDALAIGLLEGFDKHFGIETHKEGKA